MKQPLVREIQCAVARHYRVPLRSLLAHDRSTSEPRQVAMFLSRRLTGKSYHRLAERFRRDHSTVIYSENKIHRRIETSALFASKVERIRQKIAA